MLDRFAEWWWAALIVAVVTLVLSLVAGTIGAFITGVLAAGMFCAMAGALYGACSRQISSEQ